MAKTKYTRQKNGYFQTRVWDGTYDEKGRKHYKFLRSKKSSKDLENKVSEFNLKIKNRDFIRQVNISFYDYAAEWLSVYKSNAELNTKKMYDNIINKHLVNISCNISELDRRHYVYLINSTKGDRTKQQITMAMKQIVKSAIKDKLLPPDALQHIFDDSVKIKYSAPKKRSLTESEKQAIKKADFTPREKAFVYILYGCGLRRGEAIALSRFDISLERREISVNKAIAFDVNNPVLKGTKNGKERVVPIPDSVFQDLQDYIKGLKSTNLFATNGKPYITKSSLDKMWGNILKKIKAVSKDPVIGLTPHIFRHNYCSSLCYQIPNISIGKIAELLGDSKKMVIEVYNHEIMAKERPSEIVCEALSL